MIKHSINFLLFTCLTHTLFGQTIFSSASHYTVGNGPISSAIADFDQDGKMDVATSAYFGVNVIVRLGNGDGTLKSDTTYSLSGTRLGKIKAADFNNDNYPDLLVGGFGFPSASYSIFVLMNNGNGTFGSPVTLSTASPFFNGANPYSIIATDLDKDGKLDVVSANYTGTNICIFKGNGNGTFSFSTAVKTQNTPSGLIARDFNNDGNQDLIVVCSGSNTFGYFKGNGSINSFTSITYFSTGPGPYEVASGDFNSDNKLDIAMISSAARVYVHLGNANDTFGTNTNLANGAAGTEITVADFNLDGKTDIATVNSSGNYACLFLGNGNNTYQTRQDYSVNAGPEGITTGDLNNDARPDLITSNYGSGSGNTISILLNTQSYPTFTITATAGSNGSISPSGSVSARYDTSRTFTFTPNSGYVIDSVIVDGVYAGTNSSYTFTHIAANHTIRVRFAAFPTTGMIAFYPFNGNANDVSGNNYHGNYNSATLTTDRFGNPNSAYSFSGSQFIQIPYIAPFNRGSMTISAWIKTSNTGLGRIVVLPTTSGGQHFSLNSGFPVSSQTSLYFDRQAGGSAYATSGMNTSDNAWHHVVGVFDSVSSTIKMYVDGVLKSNVSYSSSPIAGNVALRIGGYAYGSWGEYFTGLIDDVTIYGSSLSAAQVRTLNIAGSISSLSSTSPSFSTRPSTLEFDSVLQHLSYSRPLTVRNTGTDTLRVRGVVFSDTAYTISNDTFNVSPGDSVILWVRFAPHTSGNHNTTITFYHNASGSSTAMNSSGYGEPGTITLKDIEYLCGCSIRRASFFNRYIGCVAGAGGRVYITTNGGTTWSLVNTGTSINLHGIRMIGNAIYILGESGLICVSYNGGASWTTFTTGTSETFYNAWFTNASYGFAVGSNGSVYRYSGGSWSAFSLGTSANFYGIYAFGNFAWAVGSGGTICRFDGTSWSPISTGTSITFHDVAFLDENFGFAIGEGGTICRSTNGGVSWTALTTGTTSTCRSIRIISSLRCLVVCEDGSVLETFDGGNTWNRVFIGNYLIQSLEVYGCTVVFTTTEGYVFSFELNGCSDNVNAFYTRLYCGSRTHMRSASFTGPGTGYFAGYGGTVLYTSNYGSSWQYSNTGIGHHIYCFRHCNGVVYFCGANGVLCYSSNGGTSWNTVSTGTTQTFYSISFNRYGRGWAVGAGGVIRYFNGSSWVNQNVNSGITFYGVYAIGNVAYAVGANGVVCKYVNGSWTPINPGVSNHFYGVWFLNERIGYIVGSGGIICKTTDGGATWIAINCGCGYPDLRSIKGGCPSELIVAGDSGVVLTSTNGGATWTKRYLDANITINEIEWNNGNGYLVANDGNTFSFSFGGTPDDLSISPSGPVSICPGTCTSLTASGSTSYLWSTSDTSRTISVCEAGTYTVRNGEGICADSAQVTVNLYNQPLVYQSSIVLRTQAQVNAFVSPTSSANCGNKWTKILGSLTVDGSSSTDPITDLSNLNRLTEVTGSVILQNFNRSGNPRHTNDLALLQTLGCNLTIISSPMLSSVSLPALRTIGCGFTIRDNDSLRTIDIPQLSSVKGDRLQVRNNKRLSDLSLSRRASTFRFIGKGSSIDITDNGTHTSDSLVMNMRKIRTVKGPFTFTNNSNRGVNNFDSIFSALDTVTGTLTITNNGYIGICCRGKNVAVTSTRKISGNTGNCANMSAVNAACGYPKRSDPGQNTAEGGSFEVAPNPFTRQFVIRPPFDQQGDMTIQVTDLLGRQVLLQTAHVTDQQDIPVDMGSVAPGQYILKLEFNGTTRVIRLMQKP